MNRTGHAVDLINAGRFDLAERLLSAQLSQAPNDFHAHRLLALCLRHRKALREALAEADEAVRLAPANSLCLADRGRVLAALGRQVQAQTDLEEAVRLDPRGVFVIGVLAAFLLDKGTIQEAASVARSGLAVDPTNRDCLSVLALTLLRSSRISDAHRVLRDALADDPARASLHNHLGLLLLHRAEWAQAEAEFEEALRLNPALSPAERNLQVAREHRARGLRVPYVLRFNYFWGHMLWTCRAAAMSALALIGLVWPDSWGLMTYLCGLEVARVARKGARTKGSADVLFRAVWIFGLIALLLLVTPPPPSTGPQDMSPMLEVITGVVLLWVLVPALVTRGRAQALALAIATAAISAAIAGALPGRTSEQTAAGLIASFVCAELAWRFVFRLERAEWTSSAPSSDVASGEER